MMSEAIELYRCTECGYVVDATKRGAIGTFHEHCEKHTGLLSFGNVEKLMEYTEKITVTEYEEVPVNIGSTSGDADGN